LEAVFFLVEGVFHLVCTTTAKERLLSPKAAELGLALLRRLGLKQAPAFNGSLAVLPGAVVLRALFRNFFVL
jgi:hypothetical protein